MPRSQSPPSQAPEEDRQGTEAVPTQAESRLQENSSGGPGKHLAKSAGESFAWNPADKHRPQVVK